MKATNIFQTLKAKGVCGTDGIPPKLPGVSSPLDKKLVGDQKNLNPGLRAAIEAYPESPAAPESPANYGTSSSMKLVPDGPSKKEVKAQKITTDLEAGTRTRYFSKEDQKKYGVPPQITSKIVKSSKDAPTTMKATPAKKKSCGYKK